MRPEAGRYLDKARYETGPDAVIPLEEAATAIETADRFVRMIEELLG